MLLRPPAIALPVAALLSLGVVFADAPPPETPHQYKHDKILVPPATADEPRRETVSTRKALELLDQGATAWSAARKCVTCHTNGTYLFARPMLGDKHGPPLMAIREFYVAELDEQMKRPAKELQADTVPQQVIYLAAGLASWDAHVEKKLSPETDKALRFMLSLQRADGSSSALDCWPPLESDSYHPAAVAAIALASAPGWLAEQKEEKTLAAVKALQDYLRTQAPHDYGRVWLLWAATKMPELLADDERKKLVEMIAKHQRADGGWSIRTFSTPEKWGRGNRAAKIKAEADIADPPSDGHMTGLAVIALRQAGIAADDERIKRGVAWLTANQRESGRWWTRSLNNDGRHYITYTATAYAMLALGLCDALPVE